MIEAKGIENNEFLQYKGRPLVRKDDEIYYGDLSKNYVKMMIMTEKSAEKSGESIPNLIVMQLFIAGKAFPERQNNASGLTDAFETATAWLDRYDK